MSNSKSTRRSLIASGLSLAVSCALLLGSTFAWFTDSVTSGNNRIAAGNLDINLQYTTDGTTWADVETDTNLFKEGALWEPGYMEVAYLKVENLGSLALKYQLNMNATDTVISTSVTGEELRLSDYLEFAVVDLPAANGAITPYDRAGAEAALESATSYALNAGYSVKDIMYPADAANAEYPAEKYIALIVYMPETAGNEANHASDAAAPEISLGINLIATQTPYETDGFGDDQYDAAAWEEVSTAEGLEQAISEGKTASLTEDITVDAIPQSPAGETNIVLNGNTLTSETANSQVVENGSVLNISNGTLSVGESIPELSSQAALLVATGSKVTMTNVEYNAGGTGVYVQGQDATIEVINSTITAPVFAIGTNAGSEANRNVNIRIINSRLETTYNSEGATVLMNVPGNLYIENSTIIGERNAVIVRGGTATIKDSVLSRPHTVNSTTEDENAFLDKDWGSGNAMPFATLLLGNRTSSAYQYATVCTLENTRVTADAEGAKTVYLYGNATEDIGVTFNYDNATVIQPADSTVEPVIYGGGYVTVNGQVQQ
ncbi:MAG TPA: M73 family metallopeptidase [Firmicutes bacterium]|nr:M73 family metallopeptidase [Bacillota bacterium]